MLWRLARERVGRDYTNIYIKKDQKSKSHLRYDSLQVKLTT